MAKCENCELCEKAQNPCIMGKGSKKAKIMFIQDCPGELDDKHGQPFYGKTCNKLRTLLEEHGITSKDVFFTSLVKCIADKEEPKPANVEACLDLIEAEIAVVDPDIIVPTGNKSLRFCVGRVGITKMRGNAQEVELCGRTRIILPTMHPRMTLRKPAYLDYIIKDMETLKDLKENGMTEVSGVKYKYLETLQDCMEEIIRLKNEAKILCFDLETTGKSAYFDDSKIVCISLTDKTHSGCVIPLYHHETPLWGWEIGTVVKMLRWLLEDESIPKVAHNGKFDIEWLHAWLDIDVKNFSFDTMLAHYLAVSEEQGTQGLKGLAWEFTDMGGYDNALDEERAKLPEAIRYNYDNIPWDVLKTYAVADVDCCLRLMEIFKPMIDENPKWKIVMDNIMMPGSYALRSIEENGMSFDVKMSEHYAQTYGDEIARITERLESYPEVLQLERQKQELWQEREKIKLIPKKDRTEEEQKKFEKYKKYENYKFNWGSVQQLSELLFDKLGLVTTITTDTGAFSTGEEALNEMREQHEIPDLLLELRKVTTLNGMFIQKLPTMRDKKDIVHPSFNISGTVTGRMSSENPNAQQFPRKAEHPLLFQYHNEPKALFNSRFGESGCILNADYSALEMRIAGIISEDEALSRAFLSGQDLHKSTASIVWEIPIEEVSKDQRTAAKKVNFGIIYGKSGVTFAKDEYYDPSGKNPKKTADWDEAKAMGNKLVEDYLNAFSGLAKWLTDTKKFAYKYGYVETMFGRRRRLPDLKSKVQTLKSNAERQAINAPIQGTGSDLTLLSLIQIQQWLSSNHMKSKMIATVHDSIVFDVYIPELAIVSATVKNIMEHVHEPYIKTNIPIISELELGVNYGSTFDVGVEECQQILTVKDFQKWNHDNKIHKFQKEVTELHKMGWDYKQVLEYLQKYDRPVKELFNFIVEEYSQEE